MTIERINLTGDRADWLAERQRWIGASEVPIVVGESRYGSLAELYAEKKGLRPPLIDSGILRRGRWGEAATFQAVAETYPEWIVQRAGVHVRDTGRRLACTPDGFATRPDRDGVGVIQAKVVSRAIYRTWEAFDDEPAAPAPYRLQTITEMMLNNTRWGVLAVLVNSEYDWALKVFEIERDAAIEDRILYHVDAFWRQYLDPGIMPPFEPQRDTELVRALYPRDDGTEIDMAGDNRALALVDEMVETRAAIARMEKSEAAIKTELCAKLGDASTGKLADGRRITWKTQNRKGYVVEPKSFRVFRILAPAKDKSNG